MATLRHAACFFFAGMILELQKMADSHTSHRESLLHDPEHWKTRDEPMTTAQRSYLETLSREAGEPLDPDVSMTKAEAALRIEELQRLTGRDRDGG